MAHGRNRKRWRAPLRPDVTALKTAEWMPHMGGAGGLFLGSLLSFLVLRGAENAAIAIAGIVFASIGGTLGGWRVGSSYGARIRRSALEKARRP